MRVHAQTAHTPSGLQLQLCIAEKVAAQPMRMGAMALHMANRVSNWAGCSPIWLPLCSVYCRALSRQQSLTSMTGWWVQPQAQFHDYCHTASLACTSKPPTKMQAQP